MSNRLQILCHPSSGGVLVRLVVLRTSGGGVLPTESRRAAVALFVPDPDEEDPGLGTLLYHVGAGASAEGRREFRRHVLVVCAPAAR